MKVRYVEGAIFAGPERVLVHGRNAFGRLGAGLAGGSWTIMSRMIEEEARAFEPVVDLFDGKRSES
jgi:hypothetical protein